MQNIDTIGYTLVFTLPGLTVLSGIILSLVLRIRRTAEPQKEKETTTRAA